MAEIDRLNHDVLREIFLYLSFCERQRMGLVCKKWQNVVEIMMGSIHKLRCHVYGLEGSWRRVQMKGSVLDITTDNIADIEKVLKKLGSHLEKIQIMDDTVKEIPPKIYKLLIKSKNLSYALLKCRRTRSCERFLKFLPTKNLEQLSIQMFHVFDDVQHELDYHVGKVLKKTPKLESLELKCVPISELPSSFGGIGTIKALYLRMVGSPRLNFDMKKLQNLEMLIYIFSNSDEVEAITKLMINCRKLRSIFFSSKDILPETTLNVMMSLPNLRRLNLLTTESSYESWHQFSNLENIHLIQHKFLFSTRNQIINFLQRSKNLKTFYVEISYNHQDYNECIQQIASDIGHECKAERCDDWIWWPDTIP
ncbi:hypothetical protein PV328_005809 [Microctonus aethiopoides]|uniref:F-box domain-containing protein n=1 Tax=Microctonus aethiopoides TaxID=144406 RepID=A0AA39FMR7_9HYME|nr:hypothetical protein PV328_005809 [Microctonus aethiopoides]